MSAATVSSVRKLRPTTRLPWAFVVVLGIATLSVVLLLGFIFFQIVYAYHILPNVAVWTVDLSNQSTTDAATLLDTHLATKFNNTPLAITDGQQTWYATPLDLGLRLDPKATAQSALDLARGDVGRQLQVAFSGSNLPPNVVLDLPTARAFLTDLAHKIDREPVDAGLQLNGLTVITTPAQIGRVLNVDKALSQLIDLGRSIDKQPRLTLPIDIRAPKIADTSSAAARLQKVINSNLTLDLPNAQPGEPTSWDLTPQQIVSLIKTELSPDGQDITIKFDDALLSAGLADLATQIDRTPENARFVFNDDTKQLDVIQPSKIGRTLNITGTIARMDEALARGEHRVTLDVVTEQPDFPDTAKAADLGITQLIATGQTFYAGSSKERMTNINAAAQQFHGIIIKPGETFSFNKYLGDVSLDKGFAEALIIFNGRTVKGVGGGVCQVSTTVFRAAFSAGFPIIERWPHAYRVSWYERGFGPGLDATVFSPDVDFKFTNDTPYALLIESYANDAAGRLTFKFYSTPDGRQVVVSDPIVENVVPHPPDKYEDDPTLPTGVTKQVDYAVDGADVTVNRTVSRDGQVISQDRIFTKYQPWQAVFMVGTGQ
ncbi:MAG: VanW family protein [Anaerolineae bacterium]